MPFAIDNTHSLPAGSLTSNGAISDATLQHNAPLQDISDCLGQVKALIPDTPLNYFATRAALQSETVPATVLTVVVGGHTVEGRGRATYVEVPNTGLVQPYQIQSNGLTRRWQISERHVTPQMLGASEGAFSLAGVTVDDTIPIQAILAWWTANPLIIPDFQARYWGLTQTIRFAQNQLYRQATAFAGTFVAMAGSSGINLVEISCRYAQIKGKLGATGAGGVSYTSRTWRNGIYFDDTSRFGLERWEAENFLRDGLRIAQPSGQNNVNCIIGSGRAVNCGSSFRQGTAELTGVVTAVVRNGGANSIAQTAVLTMQDAPPAAMETDDIIFINEPPETLNFVGDGVTKKFQLSAVGPWRSHDMTVLVDSVAVTTYDLIEKNVIEFVTAPGNTLAISITANRPRPYAVQSVAGSNITVYPWPHSTFTGGAVAYNMGAGFRSDGSNSALLQVGTVEGLRCGAMGKIGGLYAGTFAGFMAQACGINVLLGNSPNSTCLGADIGIIHAEATAFDLVGLSGVPYRAKISTSSGMGVQGFTADQDLFAQSVQLGPRNADDTWTSLWSTLKGIEIAGSNGTITERGGITRGVALTGPTLTNRPHQDFLIQKRNASTYTLRWYQNLDTLMAGYNKAEFTVFGTAANRGPTGAQTVVCDPLDVACGYTVNGGASVTIPASPFPIHVVCLMDNLGASKNWLVSWHQLSTQGELIGSVTYNPPSIATVSRVTTNVTVTGAVVGDFARASFSLALGGLYIESAEVTAADTVTVTLFNPTAGAIDLGSGSMRVVVRKAT